MPSLFRSKTVAYRDGEGRKVPRGTPGARKVTIVSKSWYGRYKDASGETKTVPLCPDRRASKEMLAKLVSDARTRQLYPEPPVSDQERRHREQGAITLDQHLQDFRAFLVHKGNSDRHADQTAGRARRVIHRCGFTLIKDIDASCVQELLSALQRSAREVPALPAEKKTFTSTELSQALGIATPSINAGLRRLGLEATGAGSPRRFPRATAEAFREQLCRGVGVQTANYYLRDIKSFCRWLVKDRRASENPLAHLSGRHASADVRHARRALSEEELLSILETARDSKESFRGLSGEDRYFLYLTAMSTGFRVSELATLTPEAFALGGDLPTATVPAAYTKNKKLAVQPLPPGVAGALAEYLKGKSAGLPLWPGTWVQKAAKMLRIDLEAAGIPYVACGPDGPEYADFHALRHSYITNVVNSGVNVKLAQSLARHSTVTLTLGRYTHVQLHDLGSAVQKLPALKRAGAGQPETRRSTGTEGSAADPAKGSIKVP
jgi:integrase